MKRENSGNRTNRPSSGRPSGTGRSSSKPGGRTGGSGRPSTGRPAQGRPASKFGKRSDEGKSDRPASKSYSGRSTGRPSSEGSFEKRPSRSYGSGAPKRRDEGGFEKRAPRTYGSSSPKRKDDGSFEKRTPRTYNSSAPKRKEDGTFERRSAKPYGSRSTGRSSGDKFERDGSKPYGGKRFDKSDDRGPKRGLGVKRGDPSVFPEKKKRAYGSADSYAERKDAKTFREVQDEGKSSDRRPAKRSEFSGNTAGKGKFTKKSELKGFRPRISRKSEEEDFRFKKPGSRGKQIDLDVKPEFVSKSKSQSKERVTEEVLSAGESIRLNRFISNAGVCSRREADELIGAGLVSINGEVVTELGSKVNAGDVVRFNGEKLAVEAKVYIILNKPKDAITTADDPEGRNTVMDIFDGKMKERIFPVGRLDRNTTGVLLLTNDGELATRLMHPKYEIKKVYKATLNKNLKPADLWTLSNGVELEDGFIKPDAIAQSDAKNKNVVGIEIHSGRNRIIHRMFENLGYLVDKLDRVLYAGLEKGPLKRGEWRELNEKELKNLKKSVHLK